jgi:uncharacterized membrane protein
MITEAKDTRVSSTRILIVTVYRIIFTGIRSRITGVNGTKIIVIANVRSVYTSSSFVTGNILTYLVRTSNRGKDTAISRTTRVLSTFVVIVTDDWYMFTSTG